MNLLNQVADKAMRGFVAVRMRPRIAYTPTDSAIILVAPQQDLLVGAVANLAQLVRIARATGTTVIYAPLARAGADIHPAIAAADGDIVLEPFDGLSAFTNPALSATLAAAGLDHVILAGTRTDVEIDSTARDAAEAGLHTTVVADCCTGSSPEGHRATVRTTLPRLVHAVLPLTALIPPTAASV